MLIYYLKLNQPKVWLNLMQNICIQDEKIL